MLTKGQFAFKSLQDDLAVQQQWYINGKHYSRTLEDWLVRMDAHKKEIIPLFQVRRRLIILCSLDVVTIGG